MPVDRTEDSDVALAVADAYFGWVAEQERKNQKRYTESTSWGRAGVGLVISSPLLARIFSDDLADSLERASDAIRLPMLVLCALAVLGMIIALGWSWLGTPLAKAAQERQRAAVPVAAFLREKFTSHDLSAANEYFQKELAMRGNAVESVTAIGALASATVGIVSAINGDDHTTWIAISSCAITALLAIIAWKVASNAGRDRGLIFAIERALDVG